MQAARLATRLQRELRMLQNDPPPGVCAWPCDDSLSRLEAQIQGPDGTVYANGLFKLEIRVPDRYPFEPPSVRFKTPIYHPNIDSGGRICLDILNMPPKGAWKPSLNIPTILASIGLLLAEPNPDDGLMGDITAEYKHNRLSFDITAKKWTHQYAMQKESATGDSVASDSVQQNPSTSGVNVKPSPPEGFTELRNHETRQQEIAVRLQEVQSTVEVGTTVSNKVGKSSVVSNSKLNLGTKLSLEKGPKEPGKQRINTGAVESEVASKGAFVCIENTVGTRQVAVQESLLLKKTFVESSVVKKTGKDIGAVESEVASKGAFVCIENTVGTRQVAVQESRLLKKTFVESSVVKKTGKDTHMKSEFNENSRVVDGSQTLGVSTVYNHKTKPTGPSINLERFKRPREGSVAPPTDSSPTPPNQQTCCPNREEISGIPSTSVVASVESQCLQKKSKYFTFSKASRNSIAESSELREETSNFGQHGLKGWTSDAHPVRTLLTSRSRVIEKDQIPTSDEARTSSLPKAVVETSSVFSGSPSKSSTKGVLTSMQEDEFEKNGGEPQNGVRQFQHGHSPTASGMVQSRPELQRRELQGTNVDIVFLPDGSDSGKKATKLSSAVRPEMAKKPPLSAKPAIDVIVLDSESDDEPPKGKSRLSLSMRRGAKK